jgi:hypothetical protein
VRVANRPATLTAAAGIEALEGLAMIGVGVFVAVETIIARSYSMLNAIALAVCAVALGAGLIAIGRALLQARRWGRTPALLTQFFGFVIAVYMIQGHQYAYGVPIVVAAVAALVLLFSPASTRALG